MNEKYSTLLGDLAYIMRKKKDFMRAKAYENAQNTILSIRQEIKSPKQLAGLPGIGKSIYEKLETFSKTGSLDILDENKGFIERRNAFRIFINIYGVGEKKAEELIERTSNFSSISIYSGILR